MAKSKKESTNEATASTQVIKEGAYIQSQGPADMLNGAEILRFKRSDGRKPTLDIQTGQILEVGQDLTPEEAEYLLSLENWTFERVEK